MNSHWNWTVGPAMSRRELLRRSGGGFGALALAGLLAEEARAEAHRSAQSAGARAAALPARARSGSSSCSCTAARRTSTRSTTSRCSSATTASRCRSPSRAWSRARPGNLLALAVEVPRSTARAGSRSASSSRTWPGASTTSASSTRCTARTRGTAGRCWSCTPAATRSSGRAWGRGSPTGWGPRTRTCPGFVTICPNLSHGGVNNWSSAFLPAVYQGTPIGSDGRSRPTRPRSRSSRTHRTPRTLQRLRARPDPGDEPRPPRRSPGPTRRSRAGSRRSSWPSGCRRRRRRSRTSPAESPATQRLYGLDDAATGDFGRQCLLARRFAERGVRFVQVTHSDKWDQHSGLKKDIAQQRPRGRPADRRPAHGPEGAGPARRHARPLGRRVRPHADVARATTAATTTRTASRCGWPAAASRPGIVHGETDDYGYYAVEDKVHVHDLHATILHLLGLDHTKLTYRYAGRDFRLTDVHGEVVHEILA